jgi:hypothetical protein
MPGAPSPGRRGAARGARCCPASALHQARGGTRCAILCMANIEQRAATALLPRTLVMHRTAHMGSTCTPLRVGATVATRRARGPVSAMSRRPPTSSTSTPAPDAAWAKGRHARQHTSQRPQTLPFYCQTDTPLYCHRDSAVLPSDAPAWRRGSRARRGCGCSRGHSGCGDAACARAWTRRPGPAPHRHRGPGSRLWQTPGRPDTKQSTRSVCA